MKKNLLSVAVAATILVPALPAFAQEDAMVEEVIVTGSAIQRADLESALPIQVMNADDIAATGVTSAPELMSKLTSMQGMTVAADSVGGSGGGLQTANLRDLGSQYTLVLLNGRRMASSTSGSVVDLSHIPLAAIERVEVLTDGASALYGSDAIAGVVNFILKEEVEGTTVNVRYDKPQASGGGDIASIDLTTSFGDLDEDGFTVLASIAHHEQSELAAKDREWGRTGIIEITNPVTGNTGLFFNGSTNSIPGNAYVYYTDEYRQANAVDGVLGPRNESFNPYKEANGNCAPDNAPSGDLCAFDYTSTLFILPEKETDSVFLSGKYRLGENLEGFSELVYSQRSMTTKIAPYPTGQVNLPIDSQLVQDYVLPYASVGVENIDRVTGTWRGLAAGNRTEELTSDALHFVTGVNGSVGEINFGAAAFHSSTDQEQNYPNGHLLKDEFGALVASGELNIFEPVDNLPENTAELLAPTIYNGNYSTTETATTGFDLSMDMPLFSMDGGEAQLAAGIDYRRSSYADDISEANRDALILFRQAGNTYDLERDTYGAYAEALFPVLDTLDFTASLRYDSIGGVDAVVDGTNRGTVNGTESDVTYKLSTRWTATESLSFRASYGTGFKAPSMLELARPLVNFGVTSGTYDCVFPAGDPLRDLCVAPQGFQAQVLAGGNPELTPETSTQYSVGFVLDTESGFTTTIDYWNIAMEDQVDSLTEQQIFGNWQQYRELFVPVANTSTGLNELGIVQAVVNIGESDVSGIDYRFEQTADLSFGEMLFTLGGTYMIENTNSLYGSSMGKFGSDDSVTFRNAIRGSISLSHGDFIHNLGMNYRSGYLDQANWIGLTNADGSYQTEITYNADGEASESIVYEQVQLQVPSYVTFDVQSQVALMEDQLTLKLGINNLTDREPPRTLRTSGAGHQLGFDPRYSDGYGRTVYLNAGYTF
ncbi:TonB-dependent receptor [Microbulbifer agarilyticus]|uniref:TonB-dependent receptor plug domain-containing protein n=1 Tax=Microbulbifer agarilyticus TaxID=260552 RepID=UPI001C975757|nr:TonB-dependent receptor [Microbulbifer agarilyticus]MBY6210460.1 TonB-dependent receptor [Microbulbifer agarilyticus]